MLETLRRVSKGWIMKTILGLLALTFVVFFGSSNFGGSGHGGGQSGRNTNAVLEVDNLDYSLNQVSREFNLQMQQISQASGRQIDLQSPIASSVLEQTISTIVTRSLYDVAARDLGMAASDTTIQDAIRRIPAFQTPNGGFDTALFSGYLRQRGLSEAAFVEGVREDLKRSQYLGTLRESIVVPEAMVEAFYKYRFEQRVVDLVTISAATIEGLSPPDETQILVFYEESKQFFQAPELREATVASLATEDLAATIVIDDSEVAEVYAERLDNFRQPERREILQGIFLDQESAEKAKALIDQGRPFAVAVEEFAGFPPVPMGTIARTEISEETLATAAFNAEAGTAVGPLESALGWQLLSVVSIMPEETRPLADVKETLRRTIAIEQARADIFDIQNAVEDGLAAGSSLEEVARNNGLKSQRFEPFNAGGFMRNNETIAFEPLASVVNAAFSTAQGEIGDVVETQDGGFLIVRTESITPPQVEPLDRVRDNVTAAWLDRARADLATERAGELAERLRAGGDIAQLAKEFGATFETTQPFDRTGLGSTIAGSLITPIFQAKHGDVVQAQTQNGAGVARLVEIRKVGASGGDDFERDELRQQLADAVNGDLAQQLVAALRDRYSIDVDREAIEQSILQR